MIRRLLFLFCLCSSLECRLTAAPAAPGWAPPRLVGDPLFFVQATGEPAAKAMLMYVPSEPPVLRSATLEKTWEAGKDYEWKPGTREIVLKAGSGIPFKTEAELHPAPGTPNSYRAFRERDGKSWMLFGEGRYFHDLQSVAAYATAEKWSGPQPAAAPEPQLKNLRAKLKAAAPVKVVTLGDSISTGANASGSASAPPMQPGYHELVMQGLEAEFGAKVSGKNLSVGGMDSAWGLKQVPAVLAEKPDVLLLAFGMNDASGRRKPAEYADLIRQTAEQVQKALPECDVILVSTMTANPEWSFAALDLYPQYAEELKKLTGDGRALADVTAVWKAVLERKPYLSLTGNGLNHPNDFGHRIYGDVVLATIGGK